jgi:hypothetical protein
MLDYAVRSARMARADGFARLVVLAVALVAVSLFSVPTFGQTAQPATSVSTWIDVVNGVSNIPGSMADAQNELITT